MAACPVREPVPEQCVGFVILNALRAAPAGMTRTDLRDLFDRHKPTEAISRALAVLQRAGLARSENGKETGGRPVERWFRE